MKTEKRSNIIKKSEIILIASILWKINYRCSNKYKHFVKEHLIIDWLIAINWRVEYFYEKLAL